MRRREALALIAGGGFAARSALSFQDSGPASVTPDECVPLATDYGYLWWTNGWSGKSVPTGWSQQTPVNPKLLCWQTGLYGLAIDVESLRLTHFGALAAPAAYADVLAQDQRVLNALPAGSLVITLQAGGKKYTATKAALNWTDYLNMPVRMIEAGRFLQRADIQQVQFTDSAGNVLKADARLEIIGWPDRAAFLIEVVAGQDLTNAQLEIDVATQVGRSTDAPEPLWKSGDTRRAWAAISFAPESADPVDPTLTVTASDPTRPKVGFGVSYDAARGWWAIDIPRTVWNIAADLDHLDTTTLTLTNPTGQPQLFRLMLGMDNPVGITGMTPMLRDADGSPTGIAVQVSKNWHTLTPPVLYQGPWFHGAAMLRVPANSSLTLHYDITYGHWGGVAAASHSQLSLIGYGWHQLWHEAAVGSWGESSTYDPDGIAMRCMFDDVRPLMVWAFRATPTKWDWTNNVGGGDFLVYFDDKSAYQHLVGVRSAYQAHGPNLTGFTYSGVTSDGKIAARIQVSLPRVDDLVHVYHTFRYDVLQPVKFNRLAFYQLGADSYLWYQFHLMARGNENGMVEEWKPNTGGLKYDRTGIALTGAVPWLSLHDAVAPAGTLGPWANRGMVIRSWKARLGGKDAAPFASVYETAAAKIPSAALELSAPPDVTSLQVGDFVEAQVEMLVVPMSGLDYYGPNQNLAASLAAGGNTWKPVYRQATGNALTIAPIRGTLVRAYPPMIAIDDSGGAELVVSGGVGYVPFTFTGLGGYKGWELLLSAGGADPAPVDQSVHGADFWQANYDPDTLSWSLTYNISLDTPGDQPQAVRLILMPPG